MASASAPSQPDFDIDFCETRRGEVIRYVQERYGEEQVGQIITFGTLQARAVLRDTGRILQMSYGHVDRLCKMVPNHPTDPWTLPRTLNGAADFRREYDNDDDVKRLVDLAMTLPPVIFLLVLASIAGTGIVPTIVVISLLSWPVLSRMVRARLLELRERDFVVASRGMGASMWHLLFRHGLPNCIDIIVVYATLQIANAILLEAGLSFLGLGIAPPQASWGNMLNAARSTVVMEQYIWQWMFPGGALVLTGILTSKLPLVRDALEREGFADVTVREDGEWALVTATRA